MTDSQKLAVEAIVDTLGLETAEERIKSEFGEHSEQRYDLLGYARKYDSRLQEVDV